MGGLEMARFEAEELRNFNCTPSPKEHQSSMKEQEIDIAHRSGIEVLVGSSSSLAGSI